MLTVPEMVWIVEILGHYLDEVRPLFTPPESGGVASSSNVDTVLK